MSDKPIGIFVLAYGTPGTLEDVEPYYTHIRGGRPPSPEALHDLRERYRKVGGRTPLLDLSDSVAQQLQQRLDADGAGRYRVYLGMKHWHPYIGDVVPQIVADGVEQVVAVVLAPHYSRYSLEGYRKYIQKALEHVEQPFQLHFIESWHLNPGFLEMTARRIRAAAEQFPQPGLDAVKVLFSAHSLPEKIVTMGDPYPQYLRESAAAVAERLGLADWRFCFQSAGMTGDPWLGPDILDYLDTLHEEGVTQVLSVPFGFVAEHLEVLWDIDTEAQDKAAEHGMALRRIAMPNADAEFVAVIESVVREALAAL
ncbi:ferrochelatase [Chloroflexia bacterium SDU3-3]|nr:ferrochelatase [Chloroflexia bacterium SDU3-3]